jgi:deoxyribonuclease-4
MSALFGPAGSDENFKSLGYKTTTQIPEFLGKIGLDAFEVQFGRGVRISKEKAEELGKFALEYGIQLSIHGPYYISLSSVEKEKRDNSINYILQSARVAKMMDAKRVIVHSGSCRNITRELSLEYAKDTLKNAMNALDEEGLGNITICPETMGKINQLGTLDEVMELCLVDERLVPCIDFGHLNARDFGAIKTKDDYIKILDRIENKLGFDRLKIFHSHFSKIEYTQAGGEVRHLTFEDTIYGPDFEPLAELVAKKKLSPTFICESNDTQSIDALKMKKMYQKLEGEIK